MRNWIPEIPLRDCVEWQVASSLWLNHRACTRKTPMCWLASWPGEDARLGARQRMAKDVRDLRANFGTKYNKGALEAIKYAKTRPEFRK